MSVFAWLRGLRNTLTATNRRVRRSTPRRRPPLRLETLEDRITPSGGLPDPTFGTNGLVTLPNSTADIVMGTAVQADGKIIAVGLEGTTYTAVTRLNGDGTLDQSFGTHGTTTITIGKSANPSAVALQPDGKILVVATVNSSGSDTEYAIARFNQNGALDTSIGNNHGWWLTNPTSGAEGLSKIAVVSNGSSFSIYAAGGQGRQRQRGHRLYRHDSLYEQRRARRTARQLYLHRR